MQVSVEQNNSLERTMTISVPSSRVELEVEKRLKKTAKTANISGFRPGKAPLSFIRKHYENGARSAVFEELVNQTFSEAIKEHDFKLAGQPKIETKVFEKNKDLEYTANFELFPTITLPDFNQIKINKITSEITDQDIDVMLELLRKQATTYTKVERNAQNNDQVKIDFIGFIDDQEFNGGSAKDMLLILGSKQMITGFEEGLIGKNAGDNVSLNIKFPEDYHQQDLAGKEARFEITIHEVAEPQVPELNTEFFHTFAVKVDNLADFKAEVAKNMQREMHKIIHNKMRVLVIDALLEVSSIEIPKVMVHNEIHNLKHQAVQNFANQHQTIDAHKLPDDLFKDRAERNVKASLLFAEIINKFELKPNDNRVRALIEEVATMYQDSEQMVSHIYKNERMLNDIKALALEERVIEVLLDKAQVTEQKISYQELTNPQHTHE